MQLFVTLSFLLWRSATLTYGEAFMLNLKKFSVVFMGVFAVMALTACCDSSQGSNQNAQMQHFDGRAEVSSNYFVSVENGVVQGAYYKYDHEKDSFDYRLLASFYPYPEIVKSYDTISRGNITYTLSQAPAELQTFWQVMYERAAEDAEAMGYTMAEPLVSVDTQSLEDFEAEIESLKADIESYKAALEEAKTQSVDLGKTVDTLTASLAKAEAELVDVTKQRDAYKQAFEKFKSSIPSFE